MGFLGKYEYDQEQGGLGFRDLHGFNLALLGKRVWNFVTN